MGYSGFGCLTCGSFLLGSKRTFFFFLKRERCYCALRFLIPDTSELLSGTNSFDLKDFVAHKGYLCNALRLEARHLWAGLNIICDRSRTLFRGIVFEWHGKLKYTMKIALIVIKGIKPFFFLLSFSVSILKI